MGDRRRSPALFNLPFLPFYSSINCLTVIVIPSLPASAEISHSIR